MTIGNDKKSVGQFVSGADSLSGNREKLHASGVMQLGAAAIDPKAQ